ncbi:MAG: hypothetical protein KIT27_00125 [Legionellales bacterium]|nr:hypothetical protein [Legionellales bacterium]
MTFYKSYFFAILLIFTTSPVFAICETQIWVESNFGVSFYAGQLDVKYLIGTYSPKIIQRKFSNNRLCVNQGYIFAVGSNHVVYQSRKLINNKNALIFLEFPKDFMVKPYSVGDATHHVLHQFIPTTF